MLTAPHLTVYLLPECLHYRPGNLAPAFQWHILLSIRIPAILRGIGRMRRIRRLHTLASNTRAISRYLAVFALPLTCVISHLLAA